MNYDVRIETSPEQPIAIVHRRASRPQLGAVVQQACGLVWNVLWAQQVVGAGRHLAIYWDDLVNLVVFCLGSAVD